MNYQTLVVDPFEEYCVLTLNRPDKANALNGVMRRELKDFLDHAEKAFKAVVITGAGNAFTGGLDLSEGGGEAASAELWEITHSIYGSSAIFVAAVNGPARGGGVTLTNASDLAIASTKANFGIPEIGFGVYATLAGPTTQLSVSRKTAAEMVLLGEPLSAERAAQVSLVNGVLAPDQLMARACEIAARLTKFDRHVLGVCKKGLNSMPVDDAMRREGEALSQLLNVQIREGSNSRTPPAVEPTPS